MLLSAPRTRGWSSPSTRSSSRASVGPAHAGMVLTSRSSSVITSGRPRARGDGPTWMRLGMLAAGSAPRTRGWSVGAVQRFVVRLVGPAHAGMVHRQGCVRGAQGSRPRARGDGPFGLLPTDATEASAPRTRGWSPRLAPANPGRVVGPAHAGMVLTPSEHPQAVASRPRARGDGPARWCGRSHPKASAPRTRGWSRVLNLLDLGAGVGPAHAGMVPPHRAAAGHSAGRPRARGDGP